MTLTWNLWHFIYSIVVWQCIMFFALSYGSNVATKYAENVFILNLFPLFQSLSQVMNASMEELARYQELVSGRYCIHLPFLPFIVNVAVRCAHLVCLWQELKHTSWSALLLCLIAWRTPFPLINVHIICSTVVGKTTLRYFPWAVQTGFHPPKPCSPWYSWQRESIRSTFIDEW